MKKYVLGLLIACFSGASQAAVCFNDLKSYEAVRAKLPVFMQNYSLYGINKTFTLVAAVGIEVQGSRFAYSVKGQHILFGHHEESSFLNSICIDGSSIRVATDNGLEASGTYNAKGVTTFGYTFKVVDAVTYRQFRDSMLMAPMFLTPENPVDPLFESIPAYPADLF